MSVLINKNLKTKFEKIFWITFFWTLIALFQFLLGYATLLQVNCDISGIDPGVYFTGSIVTGISAGIIGGTSMVFFWEKWLRNKSYRWSLLNIFWSYTVVFAIVAVISALSHYSSELGVPFFHPNALKAFFIQSSLSQVQSYLFWLFIVIITMIMLLVNDKYGPGVFKSFILGKYFQPKREERIFMFMDLRGSTSIAENLGEERYFNFLKDLIEDATPGILKSNGEIYQYVGDEIVVSWKKEVGFENANCLKCYFEISERIRNRSSYYKEYYGIVPEYKAGLHYGPVTVGEIGIIKREIAYSGDVLNTTSRIQSKCNELGVNILFSKYLLDKLGNLPNPFHSISIGEISLRGKQNAIKLYTV